MILQHENLGTCKVHLEVSLNNGKCFKLIESYKVKKTKTYWDRRRWGRTEEVWSDSRSDRRNKLPHYYALWGNTQDDWRMGCTKLTTAKGSNVRSFSSASKKFFELVKASEKMTFKL